MAIEFYGLLNDIHFPFEHRAGYKKALELFKRKKITRLFLNGDIGEFQGVSTHPIHPTEKTNFCDEIDYLNKKFDELTEWDIPVTYICGNHEYRFFRYIRDIAPHMWGLMDCPLLLKFEQRPRWKFHDYGPTQLVRAGAANLWLRHEPLITSVRHCAGTAEKALVDIAYGHTHTYQVSTHRKFGPSPLMVKAYSCGYLGDKSRHVFDYRGSKDNWVEGCSLIEVDTKTGEYKLEFHYL